MDKQQAGKNNIHGNEERDVTHFYRPVQGGQLSPAPCQTCQGHVTPGPGSRTLRPFRQDVHKAGYPNHPKDPATSKIRSCFPNPFVMGLIMQKQIHPEKNSTELKSMLYKCAHRALFVREEREREMHMNC